MFWSTYLNAFEIKMINSLKEKSKAFLNSLNEDELVSLMDALLYYDVDPVRTDFEMLVFNERDARLKEKK